MNIETREGGATALTTKEGDDLALICAILAKATIAAASISAPRVGSIASQRGGSDLKEADHAIIEFLNRHGEAAPNRIAEALTLTRTPLRKALSRLGAAGLIQFCGTTRNRIVRPSVIATRAAA